MSSGSGCQAKTFLRDRGLEPNRLVTDRATLINFRRMSAVLKLLGDPDSDFLVDIAADGVPIGVDVELPRTPAGEPVPGATAMKSSASGGYQHKVRT